MTSQFKDNNVNKEKELRGRWIAALHEAGHLVGAQVMLNDTGGAVLVSVNGGTAGKAFIDVGDPPRSFGEALAIAAGPAAEGLAEFHAAPTTHPCPAEVVRPDVSPTKSSHASIATSMQAGETDALRLTKWCCESVPGQPERWARRHHWINREAKFLVRDHARKIVEIARELYSQGVKLCRREKSEETQ